MKEFKLSMGSLGWVITELTRLLQSTGKTYRLSIVEWREKRSLSQNALMWVWLSEINKQKPLKTGSENIKGEDLWHEVFKKYYCPVKSISDGNASLQVKSTKLLDVGEMTYYLNKIEQFCIDRGIILTIPETSEYYQLMQRQVE